MTLEHQNVNSMQQSVNSRAAEQGAAHAGGESVAHGAMRQLQTSMQHVAAVVELSGSCVHNDDCTWHFALSDLFCSFVK